MGRKAVPGLTGRLAPTEGITKSSSEAPTQVRSDFDRLVRSIRLNIGPRLTSARLHLEPPQLGRVEVDVRMNGTALQIGVRTETLDARHLLVQRVAALEAALENCGINVERFEIDVDFLGRETPDLGAAGDEDVAGQSGEEEPLPRYQSKGARRDAPEVGGNVELEGEQVAAVAAETRLDIRA
jgi:flagellar hook-length control protein FliK